ncbi:MAG: hypothetical protein JXB17_06810 [Bacteroidales bacterium]|nr:hypothetical protein [Bacteroidales bacterium]
MRKIIFLIIINFIFSSRMVFSYKADSFLYDKNEVEQQFSQLSELEAYVKERNFINYDEIKIERPDLIENLHVFDFDKIFSINENNPLYVSSCLCGFTVGLAGTCCLGFFGPIGGAGITALVYIISSEDIRKQEAKEAFLGCTAGTLIGGVIWALIFLTPLALN